MASSKSLVINCGTTHVSAATFAVSGDKLVLESLITHELRYDFSADEKWLDATSNALRAVIRTHPKIRGKATFILPGYQLFTKPIKVPHVEPSKQTQIIAFEAQNNMPFPLHEVVWGSQIIADDGVETEIILIAQKLDAATRFCGVMGTLGLEPVALQPASLLDLNAYRLAYPGDDQDTLLINVGARSTNLTFVSPAGFFVRNINLGGNTLTQAIADVIGKPFPEAEEVKVTLFSGRPGLAPNDPAIPQIQVKAAEFMRRLSQEITRSIVTYRRASGRAAPQRILLSGRASKLKGLAEFLVDSQKIDVTNFTPGQILTVKKGIDPVTLENMTAQMNELVGEAARLKDPKAVGVNLLPRAIRERLQFEKQKPFLVLAAACLALAPAPAIFLFYTKTQQFNKEAAIVKTTVKKLTDMDTSIKTEVKKADDVAAQIAQYQALGNSRFNWISFFSDLQKQLVGAKDVWLDKLEVSRKLPLKPGAPGTTPDPTVPVVPEGPPPVPEYKVIISGKMLLRDYDPKNPNSFNASAASARIRGLMNNLTSSPFVKLVETNQTLDFQTTPRLCLFTFTLDINPDKPL